LLLLFEMTNFLNISSNNTSNTIFVFFHQFSLIIKFSFIEKKKMTFTIISMNIHHIVKSLLFVLSLLSYANTSDSRPPIIWDPYHPL